MKKLVISLGFVAATISSASANVLCEIITKDPRYNVSSYVRSQTACRTTSYASSSGIGSAVVKLGALYLVASALTYMAHHSTNQRMIEDILSDDYKTLDCFSPSRQLNYKFLVGKNYAINENSTANYTKTSDGLYERGFNTSYTLDMKKLAVYGNGNAGKADLTCKVLDEVNVAKIQQVDEE